MKTLACINCAKRKVRCDRLEPACSNCKRRKKDHCSYPQVSAADRIQRLETEIRRLGGDSNASLVDAPSENQVVVSNDKQASRPEGFLGLQYGGEGAETGRTQSGDAVLLEEGGQSFYLESRAWASWQDTTQQDANGRRHELGNPFLVRNNPGAFANMFSSTNSINFASKLPSPQHASILWHIFYERVEPLIRISFRWTLEDLKSRSTAGKPLTDAEYGFLFALYLLSVVSLSEEECDFQFDQRRPDLLSSLQNSCEAAVTSTNLFCISDIVVLKALAMYIMAGAERLSTASMWSLMGLILRNSEKLGIHRDGTLLGLSPASTEERRRLWWQLQHFDLGLAVMTGVTSLTLMADWDTKLPLNIEDEDIHPDMRQAPCERHGLTSMSYCLYTYWVIQHQRAFFKSIQGQFELSWQSKESLPEVSKEMLIEQLEEGLNTKFLQFCDPIVPIEVLLQLSARALICMLRLRTLYTLSPNEQMNLERREKLVTASMRSLEYNIATHSHPTIRPFKWWIQGMFPWHSLVCILIEASRQHDPSKIQHIWELLSRVYDANTSLYQLSTDRRRLHAAELVLSASKARQMKSNLSNCPPTPEFVIKLEAQVAGLGGKSADASTAPSLNITCNLSTDFRALENDGSFDLDFQDVDWGFWESIG